jgi:hypothetical protein
MLTNNGIICQIINVTMYCDQTTGHRTVWILPVVESDLFFLLTVNLFWLRITLHYYWDCMVATSRGSWKLITSEWDDVGLWWGVELQLWIKAVGNAWQLRRFGVKKNKASEGVHKLVWLKNAVEIRLVRIMRKRGGRCRAWKRDLFVDRDFWAGFCERCVDQHWRWKR